MFFISSTSLFLESPYYSGIIPDSFSCLIFLKLFQRVLLVPALLAVPCSMSCDQVCVYIVWEQSGLGQLDKV